MRNHTSPQQSSIGFLSDGPVSMLGAHFTSEAFMNDFSREREAWLDHQENLKRLAEKPIKPLYESAVWLILLAIMSLMCWMVWGLQ